MSPRQQTGVADQFPLTNPDDRAPSPPIATYFQQSCPTCGRALLILVEHLGRQVFCSHCRSRFIASDGSQNHHAGSSVGRTIMERAERLDTTS